MSYLQPVDRQQLTMLGCLDDMIPTHHPIRLLDELVERIVQENPTDFPPAGFGEVGRPSYSPATMLKLFFYGHLNNIRSSRRLELEAHRNIELIWLLGRLQPDHWTIAQYRKNYADQISTFSTKLRQFLHAQGYIRAEQIALDGSKFKANASRDMLTEESLRRRLAQSERDLEKYLTILGDNDQREECEDDNEQDPPSDATLNTKIAELQQRIQILTVQAQQLHDSGKTYLSPADPEAQLVKSRDGKHPGYNVQCAVDGQHGLIVADLVITDANDVRALPVMINAVKDELQTEPSGVFVADKGFHNPDLTEQAEQTHPSVRCYVAVRESRNHYPDSPITFRYDREHDCFWCSEGKPLPLQDGNVQTRNGAYDRYRGTECLPCPQKAICTTSSGGRQVNRFVNQDWRTEYRARMESTTAKALLRTRKCLIEHCFGTMKCWAGKIPLLLRGRSKVATEIKLLTTAFNLKRLFNLSSYELLMKQITTHRWTLA